MIKICVLMSTYNGEKFLREQLDSLKNQQLPEDYSLSILVRDDGSTDETINILNEYQNNGLLSWYIGKNLKPARSFWDLVKNAPESDYYCFCDQDDVWFEDKIKRAIERLFLEEKNQPLLYCSEVTIADEKLNSRGNWFSYKKANTSFPYSLLFSLSPGCTMVFNDKARNELIKYDMSNECVVMHDWLTHRIVAMLGKVVYDDNPTMYYRQHGNNVIGASEKNIIKRFIGKTKRVLGPYSNIRSDVAKSLLNVYGEQVDDKDHHTIELIANYRSDKKIKRELLKIKHLDTLKLNVCIKVLILLNKI